jgi:hypothetical protein
MSREPLRGDDKDLTGCAAYHECRAHYRITNRSMVLYNVFEMLTIGLKCPSVRRGSMHYQSAISVDISTSLPES